MIEVLLELPQERPAFLHRRLQLFRVRLPCLLVRVDDLARLLCELAAVLREREARVEKLRVNLPTASGALVIPTINA